MAVEHEMKITGTHNQDLVAQLAAQIAAGVIARAVNEMPSTELVVTTSMRIAKAIFEASHA
jgi:hypothetical protein